MKLVPFNTRLKTARQMLKLTQAELAERAQMRRHRLADLEQGRRFPTPQEVARLTRALRLPPGALEATEPPSRAVSQAHRLFGSRLPDPKPERARPTWIRLLHASRCHRQLYLWLTKPVRQRTDYPLVRRFLREAVSDSRFEVLAWLHLLKHNLKTEWLAPLRCSFRTHPVFDGRSSGDLRWPALVGTDPFPVVLFPQLPLLVPGGPRRLDLLIGVRLSRKRTVWANGEVDGPLHDAADDAERTVQIALPRLEMGRQDILSPDFVDRLWQRLSEL
ncbi:MAG: hypothetical protein AMXMBFR33_57380 [Candidatus Xenobia bacterium]